MIRLSPEIRLLRKAVLLNDVAAVKALMTRPDAIHWDAPLSDEQGQIPEDKDQPNALMLAAAMGYTDMVSLLLNKISPSSKDQKGNNALMLAVQYNQMSTVQALLSVSDSHAVNNSNMTALMIAARKGHLDMVDTLLPVSNPNAQDKSQWNALTLATFSQHHAVIDRLWPLTDGLDGPSSTAQLLFTVACQEGVIKVVERCLFLVDVNHIHDETQVAALGSAANRGHTEIVRQLLEKGANPNQLNQEGSTALMDAAYRGYDEVVTLLAPVTDLSVRNTPQDNDALDLAMGEGYERCAQAMTPFLSHERIQRAMVTCAGKPRWAPVVSQWEARLLRDTVNEMPGMDEIVPGKPRVRL